MNRKVMDKLLLLRIYRDTKGQDLIEYALISGLIAVAVGATMPNFTQNLSTVYSRITSVLSASANTGS